MDMEPFDGPSALGPDTVDSINNLDTARMSLRWALERLSTLGRENEQLRQKMDAESKARAQLEKDYQALQKISELQPPEPSKRKSFQDKLHGFVLMALAGKLDVAPILQREMKAQELEATARDSSMKASARPRPSPRSSFPLHTCQSSFQLAANPSCLYAKSIYVSSMYATVYGLGIQTMVEIGAPPKSN
jgi:hypothetical protein